MPSHHRARRLIFTTLALTGSLLTTSCSSSESAAEAFAKGQTAINEQAWRTAVIELKNALAATEPQLDTASAARARALLGQALMRLGNAVGAEQELTRAQQAGAAFTDYQPWLAQAWLQTDKLDQIVALTIPADLAAPIAAELLAIQATAEFLRGHAADADAKIAAARGRDPQGIFPQLAQARMLLARADTDGARTLAQQVLTQKADSLDALSLLGDIERTANQLAAAEAAYSQALTKLPTLAQVRLNRTLIRIQLRQFDAAREDIAALRDQLDKNPQVDYAEGVLFYAEKNYTQAIEKFDIVLGSNPDFTPALFFLGASHLAEGQIELARLNLQRFVAARPDDVNGLRLLSTAALQGGDAVEAERVARELLKQSPDDTVALDLLANALASQGKTAESLDYLRQVKNQAPDSAQASARLGTVLLAQGDTEAGLRELKTALQQEPTLAGAAEQLIAGYLRSKKPQQALAEAVAWTQREPTSARAQVILGAVYAAQRQWTEATAAYQQALKLDASDLSAINGLTLIALENKDVARAQQILRDGLIARPDHPGLLIALAKLAIINKDNQQALQLLQQAVDKNPDALEAKLYLAAYYLQQNALDKVNELIAPLLKAQPKQAAILELAAEAALTGNDFAAARAHLESLRQQRPKDARVLTALARAEAGVGNITAAKVQLQAAIEVNPKFAPALAAQARLALADTNPAAANEPLNAAAAVLGENHPDILLMTAQQAQRQGRPDTAIAAFKKALDVSNIKTNFDQDDKQWYLVEQLVLGFMRLGDKATALRAGQALEQFQPDSARVQTLLGLLYLNNTKMPEAERAFNQALTIEPGAIAATSGLATLALYAKNPQLAQAQYEKSLALHPGHAALLSGLASVALAQNDKVSAKQYLETAVERNPQQLEPALQLAAFHLQQNEPQAALSVLLPRSDMQANNRIFLGLLAQAHAVARDFTAAYNTLEQLAKLMPNDAKVWLAQADTLLNLNRIDQAESALQQAIKLNADAAPALLMRARIALARRDVKGLKTSLAELKRLPAAETKVVANDIGLLEAKLAELTGDWQAAIVHYKTLLEQSPNAINVMRLSYAQTQAKQITASETTLQDWLDIHPQDSAVRFTLGQHYLVNQRESDAIEQFTLGLANDTNNAVALNNLAWLLRERQPQKALEYARMAHKQAPQLLEVKDTLSIVLMLQDQLDEARQLNRDVLQMQPENLNFLFHRAQILQAAGDTRAAISTLEQILTQSAKAEFAERDAAKGLLARLKTNGN
ncbi:PEP-CTERM system TPR-repeat protein PrsT [Rhodoferax sp. 4810]|uniref:PEP-CTERM system TPR-repeat protein PrsT n=1 Tax=Thiospirillum jenense TaxID=1653858 RepID=A0A839HID5_9GAMM|nr:XrtA/PEP-CTERM system TPR-repeat protein PrsT [Thiospirillum jenense]MBB1074809.1 PEP-CTERM system TPR-repeat protein PrsT [Rhodoferax jenense]MBB1126647.1 PEP-CTERM system TPR-repeat protein PrsT [Thiospirillum jenense]